jgi:hypothetical protein
MRVARWAGAQMTDGQWSWRPGKGLKLPIPCPLNAARETVAVPRWRLGWYKRDSALCGELSLICSVCRRSEKNVFL